MDMRDVVEHRVDRRVCASVMVLATPLAGYRLQAWRSQWVPEPRPPAERLELRSSLVRELLPGGAGRRGAAARVTVLEVPTNGAVSLGVRFVLSARA